MLLNQTLESFRQFLISVDSELPEWLKQNDEYMAEFYQANWEVMVETRLKALELIQSFIDVYGEGADSNGNSSRVSLPHAIPKNSVQMQKYYVFHSYGTMVQGYYQMGYPYDFVKAEHPDGTEIIIAVNEADYLIGDSYDDIAAQL